MNNRLRSILAVASLLVFASSLRAQAVYTATRGIRIQAGAGGLYLRNDYTDQPNYGVTAWGDVDFLRLYRFQAGVEGEVHFGGIISPSDIGENTYMVGPRLNYRRNKLNVYGKIMVGRGTISNQLFNTSSSFNVFAYGGGAEYKITRKINLRPVDVELQKWPDFEPHTLSPLAVSFGVSYIIR